MGYGAWTKTVCGGVMVLPLLVGFSVAVADEVTYKVIAQHQHPAPYTDQKFFDFQPPVINQQGKVAFRATTVNQGGGNMTDGIWEGDQDDLAPVALQNQPAVGVPPGQTYGNGFITTPLITDSGDVCFSGMLNQAPIGSSQGIWLGSSQNLSKVMRGGDRAPGTEEETVFRTSSSFRAVMGSGSHCAFHSQLAGPKVQYGYTDSGIWSGSGSGSDLALVARDGDQAPGFSEGINYTGLNDAKWVLSPNGTIALSAYAARPGSSSHAIWIGQPTNMSLALKTNDPAPGFAGNVRFRLFSMKGINQSDDILFMSDYNGSPSGYGQGLWKRSNEGLALVAQSGAQAPGLASGIKLSFDADSPAMLNHNGNVALLSKLSGTGITTSNDETIWSGDPANIALVAREGNQAPGLPAGVMFGTFGTPVLNGAGQIAFTSRLTGTGVDITNSLALWATDTFGNLKIVARTGDWFDVTPVERGRISDILLAAGSGGEDGRGSSFNDAGELAYQMFTLIPNSYEEIMVATIPEPSSAIAILLAGAFFSGIHRTRRRR